MTALLLLMENCNISQKMAGGGESAIAGHHNLTDELMKTVNLDEDKGWGEKNIQGQKRNDCFSSLMAYHSFP